MGTNKNTIIGCVILDGGEALPARFSPPLHPKSCHFGPVWIEALEGNACQATNLDHQALKINGLICCLVRQPCLGTQPNNLGATQGVTLACVDGAGYNMG